MMLGVAMQQRLKNLVGQEPPQPGEMRWIEGMGLHFNSPGQENHAGFQRKSIQHRLQRHGVRPSEPR